MADDTGQYNLPVEQVQISEDDVRSIVSAYLSEVGVYPLTRKYSNEVVLYKNANEARLATTTLANDADFFFTAEAGANYLIDMMIFWNCVSNGGNGAFTFNFSLPAGATYTGQFTPGNLVASNTISNAANISVSSVGTNTDRVTIVKGVVKIGTTAGPVNFQWLADKNNPGDVVTITHYKGSWMIYKKLIYEDRPQK